jgi:cobalamin biosynthesis protein CbiD
MSRETGRCASAAAWATILLVVRSKDIEEILWVVGNIPCPVAEAPMLV